MVDIAVTGIGITTAVGQGKEEVARALASGTHAFRIMQRPGRQHDGSRFIGAEIPMLRTAQRPQEKTARTSSWTAQVALATLAEAWDEARLADVDPTRIGLVVAGSNVQQRELVLLQDAYRDRFDFLRPTYGQMFMDTDIAAICSEHFGITGTAFTVGGASASGHLAIAQAESAVRSGQLDACVALGALMDLSYWECQGLRALGAMGSDRHAGEPAMACRPFDGARDGFIFGESCGAVVLERAGELRTAPYATVLGWSWNVDGNRNPNPSLAGEIRAIHTALQTARLAPADVDYINPHGTGSIIGDEIELQALKTCGLGGARINATKSLLGHGLSSAGTVEFAVTLLQMRGGYLHPTRNLEAPIDASFAWVREPLLHERIENALTLSLGFGGVNSAICLRNCAT